MSIYFIDGDESIDYTKVCAVQKSYSDYTRGIVVLLQGGHTVPINGDKADNFIKAYRIFQEKTEWEEDEEILQKSDTDYCREM